MPLESAVSKYTVLNFCLPEGCKITERCGNKLLCQNIALFYCVNISLDHVKHRYKTNLILLENGFTVFIGKIVKT